MDFDKSNKDVKTPWDGITIQKAPVEVVEAPAEPEEIEEEEVSEIPEETDLITKQVSSDEIETDEPSDSEESDEEKEINPYFYLSSQLKSDGFLLEDFEPSESVSGMEVYNAYQKKLEKELEPRIRQQVLNKLENEGVTNEDLLVARAIRQGVDLAMLSESTMHERYASLSDQVDRDVKLAAIKSMYQSRNFSPKEIENLLSIATAEEDESLDDYFTESKNFHKSRWQDFQRQEAERVAQETQAQQAQLDAAEKLVNNIFSTKKLFGENLSDQETAVLREAIYSPTDRVEVNGQEYMVSKLYRFNYELETNPELKLWLLKKYILKDADLDNIKKEVASELEKDMMKAYEASVKKDVLSKKKKEVAKQLDKGSETEKSTRKSWMVEF